METLHLSLYGTKNGRKIHLTHTTSTNLHLMAFVDGYGKEYLRNGNEIKPAKIEAYAIASECGAVVLDDEEPEAALLYEISGGFRPGSMRPDELVKLYGNAKDFFYPRYCEREAEAMRPEKWFKDLGLELRLDAGNDTVTLQGFDEIQVIYWYTK